MQSMKKRMALYGYKEEDYLLTHSSAAQVMKSVSQPKPDVIKNGVRPEVKILDNKVSKNSPVEVKKYEQKEVRKPVVYKSPVRSRRESEIIAPNIN